MQTSRPLCYNQQIQVMQPNSDFENIDTISEQSFALPCEEEEICEPTSFRLSTEGDEEFHDSTPPPRSHASPYSTLHRVHQNTQLRLGPPTVPKILTKASKHDHQTKMFHPTIVIRTTYKGFVPASPLIISPRRIGYRPSEDTHFSKFNQQYIIKAKNSNLLPILFKNVHHVKVHELASSIMMS